MTALMMGIHMNLVENSMLSVEFIFLELEPVPTDFHIMLMFLS